MGKRTVLLFHWFGFSSSEQHANQAAVRPICADLTNNA